MPRERVRVVYMDGPQVYGRTAADDVGFEAAFLAHELGRPVRVQWMRHEETAWDTKGPAYDFKLRGGLDAQGKLTALEYDARAVDYNHLGYNEPDTVLIAQLMGRRRETPTAGGAETPSIQYGIPNQRLTAHVVASADDLGNTAAHRQPARPEWSTGHVRVRGVHRRARGGARKRSGAVPSRPASRRAQRTTSFARRARSPSCARPLDKYGWDARPSPKPRGRGQRSLAGRGIAYTYRSNTVVAVIAEVEVNRETGGVWVKRFVCAHDCGLAINPMGLQSHRRVRHVARLEPRAVGRGAVRYREGHERRLGHSPEAAAFGHAGNASTSCWSTAIRTRIVPDLPHYGAGETSHKP